MTRTDMRVCSGRVSAMSQKLWWPLESESGSHTENMKCISYGPWLKMFEKH